MVSSLNERRGTGDERRTKLLPHLLHIDSASASNGSHLKPDASLVSRQTSHVKQAGFTLIEILVVLIIIAVLVSLTTLNTNNDTRKLQQEARRLEHVLNTARQQAVLFSFDLGLRLTEQGYSLYRWEQGHWTQLSKPEALVAYTYGVPLKQELFIDQQLTENSKVPNLHFFATGETTPFEWSLAFNGERWLLKGDLLGQYTMESENEK